MSLAKEAWNGCGNSCVFNGACSRILQQLETFQGYMSEVGHSGFEGILYWSLLLINGHAPHYYLMIAVGR